jgi:hypothetical protein
MKSLATLAVVGTLLVPSVAFAQGGPATIRGVAYYCADHGPMPSALITLHPLDGGADMQQETDAHGRFTRVGLTPGRYIVSVEGRGTPYQGRYVFRANAVSRLARLEADDVLDMSIGGTSLITISRHGHPPDPNQPHPLCDTALVPPAPATTDRYIIR